MFFNQQKNRRRKSTENHPTIEEELLHGETNETFPDSLGGEPSYENRPRKAQFPSKKNQLNRVRRREQLRYH